MKENIKLYLRRKLQPWTKVFRKFSLYTIKPGLHTCCRNAYLCSHVRIWPFFSHCIVNFTLLNFIHTAKLSLFYILFTCKLLYSCKRSWLHYSRFHLAIAHMGSPPRERRVYFEACFTAGYSGKTVQCTMNELHQTGTTCEAV